jgi:Rod binding domain-containing protein
MSAGIAGIRLMPLDSGAVKDQKTSAAAGQFESLLIAQMLKSVRESESGWLGTGADSSSDSVMGMAEEHLASAITAAGGFGLGKLVKSGLETPNLGGSVDLSSTVVSGKR